MQFRPILLEEVRSRRASLDILVKEALNRMRYHNTREQDRYQKVLSSYIMVDPYMTEPGARELAHFSLYGKPTPDDMLFLIIGEDTGDLISYRSHPIEGQDAFLGYLASIQKTELSPLEEKQIREAGNRRALYIGGAMSATSAVSTLALLPQSLDTYLLAAGAALLGALVGAVGIQPIEPYLRKRHRERILAEHERLIGLYDQFREEQRFVTEGIQAVLDYAGLKPILD